MKKLSQKQQAEIEKLSKKTDEITPRAVVEYARNPKTEIHKCFTWDNTEAAEQYRIGQARQLLRLCITILPGTETPTRAYVSLTQDRETPDRCYRTITSVMASEDWTENLLADAMKDMQRFRTKYHMLKKLSGVFDAMDQVQS